MKSFADFSITNKLIGLLLLTTIAALLLSSLMQAINEGLAYRENVVGNLTTVADVVATNSAAAVLFEDRGMAEQVIGSLRAEPSIVTGHIFSRSGNLIGVYKSDNSVAPSVEHTEDEHAKTMMSAVASGNSLIRFNGMYSLDIVRPIRLDNELVGSVHLRASLEPLIALFSRFAWITGGIILVVVLLVYLLSFRLQALISRPILSLAELMARVTREQDYSVRAEKSGDDEVGSLIEGFNSMLAQISARDRQLVEQHAMIDEQARNLVSANQQLRIAMQDSIRAKDAAEAASHAKSQFLARMSHEIRTPMNGVLGMTELLLDSGLVGKQRHFAETIQNSADALLGLINDILDFSKIEAGKFRLESMSLDLRETAEEVVELLSSQAQNKEIELICDVTPNMPTCVRGDVMRLRQVLTNLVGNAIKFTEEGEVILRIRHDQDENGQAWYLFEVADTGIGIREENQTMIFDLFSQEDDSTTRRYGGTGLGLAICRQIVELMGGDVGVRSVMHRGSTFWFRVPLEAAEDQSGCDDLSDLIDRSGLRVLVVDDNATNREILELQLGAWGIVADSVSSAEEALTALHAAVRIGQSYGLAVIDWHMPETNGLELARRIRADHELCDLRLVMLSSASTDDEGRSMSNAGINAYARKPVRQALLRDCLRQALTADTDATGLTGSVMSVDDTRVGRIAGARVLLVEDNPVNREVAINMLQTMRCDVAVAENGREALDQVQDGSFDIVLMDCQMPVMDGYAATRAIREWECGFPYERHIPIVALTAHALPEDRRKCLEVGMDDYLTKPFTLDQLRERLDKWRQSGRNGTKPPIEAETALPASTWSPAPSVDNDEVIQSQALRAIVSLDPENGPQLLAKLLEVFESNSGDLVRQLQQAIGNHDAAELGKAAHALKSSSGNMGAGRLSALCRDIEYAAKDGELEDMPGQIETLVTEHKLVVDQLREWQRRQNP